MRTKVYCSFCGKERAEVERLIDGPGGIAVCNECINLLHGMIHGDAPPPGELAIELAEHRKRKVLGRVPPGRASGRKPETHNETLTQ